MRTVMIPTQVILAAGVIAGCADASDEPVGPAPVRDGSVAASGLTIRSIDEWRGSACRPAVGQFRALGGVAPYSWSVEHPPPSLSLSAGPDDRAQLAFVGETAGAYPFTIVVNDADGATASLTASVDVSPPDPLDRWLIVAREAGDGHRQVDAIDVCGRVSKSPVVLSGPPGGISNATTLNRSPDGRWLAAAGRTGSAGRWLVRLFRLDDEGPQETVSVGTSNIEKPDRIAWSPDGRFVAWTTLGARGRSTVLVRLDAEDPEVVRLSPLSARHPADLGFSSDSLFLLTNQPGSEGEALSAVPVDDPEGSFALRAGTSTTFRWVAGQRRVVVSTSTGFEVIDLDDPSRARFVGVNPVLNSTPEFTVPIAPDARRVYALTHHSDGHLDVGVADATDAEVRAFTRVWSSTEPGEHAWALDPLRDGIAIFGPETTFIDTSGAGFWLHDLRAATGPGRTVQVRWSSSPRVMALVERPSGDHAVVAVNPRVRDDYHTLLEGPALALAGVSPSGRWLVATEGGAPTLIDVANGPVPLTLPESVVLGPSDRVRFTADERRLFFSSTRADGRVVLVRVNLDGNFEAASSASDVVQFEVGVGLPPIDRSGSF